jgi:hypothetical protein
MEWAQFRGYRKFYILGAEVVGGQLARAENLGFSDGVSIRQFVRLLFRTEAGWVVCHPLRTQSSRSLAQHLPKPHEQLPELRLVPLLGMQISLVVVNGIDRPPDLILVQVDLHAFYRPGAYPAVLRYDHGVECPECESFLSAYKMAAEDLADGAASLQKMSSDGLFQAHEFWKLKDKVEEPRFACEMHKKVFRLHREGHGV